MTNLKLAVVGAGHLGRIHARLLSEMPDVELAAVADPVAEAREKVAADCRTRPCADFRELIGNIDAAVIATPTRFHHAVAWEFLRAGIPLLIEKPITATVAEADELVELAERQHVTLQVGHIERFNPAFIAVLARVGQPHFVDAVRAAPFTGRSMDISVVHDLMIHDIDLVLAMFDESVVRVDAVGMGVLGRREDAAQARLEFASGAIANLSASRLSYSAAPNRRMQLWSQRGFAHIDFGNKALSVVTPCEAVRAGKFEYEALPPDEKATFKDRVFTDILRIEPVALESRNALADELRDFVDSVRTGTQPRVTGRDGREALNVAEQVIASLRSRRWQPQETAAPAPILRGPHWKTTIPQRPLHREAG